MPVLLETQDLTARFGGHVAVDSVSCRFGDGELTAIVGPNGAGKTTYFNLISGQIAASSGRVLLDGTNITGLSPARRSRLGLGRAFQLTNLFPKLSVIENVRLAVQARLGRGFRMFALADNDRQISHEVAEILLRVRLDDKSAQVVAELSHGDQRKLEVALLMALDPRVYMFDEPTAGMSVDDAPAVLDLIADLKGQSGKTVLLVEHKMDVIARLADRIIVLHNGALVAEGAPETVMASDVVQEAYMGRSLTDA